MQPANASFETPALGAGTRSAHPGAASWSFSGTAGIERFIKAARPPGAGGYHGDQAAYLSADGGASPGSIAQSIAFPAPGLYQLRYMAGRLGASSSLRVTAGGEVVEADVRPRVAGEAGNPGLELLWTAPFMIARAGAVEIRFAANETAALPGRGDALYVDQVTVVSVPSQLPDPGLDGSHWSLAGGAIVSASTLAGASGKALTLRSRGAHVAGHATSSAVTLAAGFYSLSARLGTAHPGTVCATQIGYVDGSGLVAIATLPAPSAQGHFESYTTASFALPAGDYRFRLSETCAGDYEPVQVDALSLNFAGPNLANDDFETPDARSTSSVTQPVELDAGSYVLLTRVADGVFRTTVDGVAQPWTLSARSSGASGRIAFAETQSDPFTVAKTGPVKLGFVGTDAQSLNIERVRILKVGGVAASSATAAANAAPSVSLALSINGAPAPASTIAGGNLQATATATATSGLQRLRVLRNGVALAPENAAVAPAVAAPSLSIAVSALQPGSQIYTAEATDHRGVVASASQSVSVVATGTLVNGGFEAPSQLSVPGGFTSNPSAADWTFAGTAAIQRNGSSWAAPAAPEGVQTAVLRCATGLQPGSIWQDVAFASAGSIQIVAYWATRSYNGQALAQPIRLRVGGVERGLFAASASVGFVRFTSMPISVGAGTQRIELSATQCDAERSTYLDQVQIVAAGTPPIIAPLGAAASLIAGGPGALRADVSDAGSGISSIRMSAQLTTGGTTYEQACTSTASCELNIATVAAGLYRLQVTATDSRGAQSSATTLIAASDAPAAPEVPLPPTIPIGTTAGQFAVSANGAATYSVPLAVAPGVNGLQPALSLTYNSQSGDGHVGIGWGLSGISFITRCPRTIATDGIREAINYDNITDPVTGNDAFCLDGQRLVPVAGGLTSVSCVWPPGSGTTAQCAAWEFRTEFDNYSRIIGIGDNVVAGSSGSGPTRFRVYEKSGQILEYGSRWWGVGAPRPDPQTSLVVNRSFEDTVLTDAASNPNIVLGQSYGLPASWGYFLTNSQASSQGWTFDGGSDPAYAASSGAGVQRDGSAWSASGPFSSGVNTGLQNAFIQRRGRLSTQLVLEAGRYTISLRIAGRASSSTSYGGAQSVQILLDGVVQGVVTSTTGQAFTTQAVSVQVPASGWHTLAFAGTRNDDQTAFVDDIKLAPQNGDIYSIKLFPLDRVEDRNGNYLHIDYGGTHGPQYLQNPDGSTSAVNGTVQSSYGSARIADSLPAIAPVALVAQGARPALEMYPRRLTYGMRTSTPGDGHNQASVGGIEVARVILNYEDRNDRSSLYDSGAAQMRLSKRLASVWTMVGGSDDSSLAADRDNFHWNEATGRSTSGTQCLTGAEAVCGVTMRRYVLTYGTSTGTQRSRLERITECSGDGQCLSPTSFAWQDDAPVRLTGVGSGLQAAGDGADWNWLVRNGRVADVVGDGRSRIVVRAGNALFKVCEHNGSKFSCSNWPVALPAGASALPDGQSGVEIHFADYTGDGIADLLVVSNSGAYACPAVWKGAAGIESTKTLANAFGTCVNLPDRFPAAAANSSVALAYYPPNVRMQSRLYGKPADIDGDGRMDLLFYRGDGRFEVCRAKGARPALEPDWDCLNPGYVSVTNFAYTSIDRDQELKNTVIADFNGDGRADLAMRVPAVCVNGTGSHVEGGVTVANGTAPGTQCKSPADISSKYWIICFASGSVDAAAGSAGFLKFDCASRSGAGIGGAVAAVDGEIDKFSLYDFNGDGLADFGKLVPGQGWRVCLSTGDGEFANRGTDGECPIWPGPAGAADRTIAGDFNGDGRTDLATFKSGTTWQVCLSGGSGFSCSDAVTGIPAPANCGGLCFEAFAGDFDGNGRSDVIVNASGSNGTLYFGMSSGTMPDLLQGVMTGLGAQTQIVYRPLTDASVYQKERPADGNFPALGPDDIAIQSPLYVVAQSRASTGNASDRWLQSEYFYAQLIANKWGRGIYGFRSRTTTDNVLVNAAGGERDDSNALVSASLANQRWPNAGRPDRTTRTVRRGANDYAVVASADFRYGGRSRGGTTLTGGRTVVDAIDGRSYGSYRIYEGFQVASDQRAADLDGSPLPSVATYTGLEPTTQAIDLAAYYDSYGNPLRIDTVTTIAGSNERWTQRVDNLYYAGGADTTRWLLGKLRQATTTATVTGYATNGATALTRKAAFAYEGYGGTCAGAISGQLCSETVEPDAQSGTLAPYDDRSLYAQTAYEYDAFGNRTKQTVSFYDDANGSSGLKKRSSTTSFIFGKYPAQTTQLDSSNATLDLTELRGYADGRCRLPTRLTDVNGNYATTEYDGFCRKVRETSWTHDGRRMRQSSFALSAGQLVSGRESYALATTASDGAFSIQYFDNLQRAVRTQTKVFDGSLSSSSSTFDAYGRLRSTSRPVSSAGASVVAMTRYDPDALGRVVLQTLPDGNMVRTEYAGTLTRMVRSNGNGTTNGSALPHVTVKRTNARGWIATVDTGLRTAAADVTTQKTLTTLTHAYDAFGNLTRVEAPGANASLTVKTMGYDLRGRQTALTDPDSGSWRYGYNGLGEQVRQTDARGYVTDTRYDSFGRRSNRIETQASGGDATTVWSHDCGDGLASRARGMLCAVTYSGTSGVANQTSKRTEYDRYARPIGTLTTIAGRTFRSQVGYDALGRPRYAVYPQTSAQLTPLAIRTRYTDGGHVDQIDNAETGFVYQLILSRGEDGQLSRAGVAGGLVTETATYSGDALGRINGIDTARTDGATLIAQRFSFDSMGNLISRSLSGPRNESETFGYDALDRLTVSAGSGVDDGGNYMYDAAGNLTAKSGVAMTYSAGSNRLCGFGSTSSCPSGSAAVSHDLNGNVTRYNRPDAAAVAGSDGSTLELSGYTAFNLPTRVIRSGGSAPVASADFYYDASYQRVRQLKFDAAAGQNGDILYVVPGTFEMHQDASGRAIKSIATVSGPEGAIATVTLLIDPDNPLSPRADATGESSLVSGVLSTTRVLLRDHLNSTVGEVVVLGSATAPSMGSVVVHGFGPWGNSRSPLAPQAVDLRGFTGHEHLAELGLIHMNGRLFDPTLGRFLQADLHVQSPYNAQFHNRYAYVRNNPLSLTDPSGFSAWTKFRDTWLKPAGALAAAILVPELASYLMQTYASMGSGLLLASELISTTTLSSTGNAVAAMAGGFAAGGLSGGNVQSALQGALTGGLTSGLATNFDLHGLALFGNEQHLGQVALHAAMGCGQSALAGGSCRSGAAAGLTSALASPEVTGSMTAKLVKQAIIGGLASRLSGGKFENGAMTAAFSYLFNEAADRIVARAKREVVAVDSGVVIKVGWENPDNPKQGFGFSIQIRSTDGDTTWRYAHMEATTRVFEGMLVLEGDVIGRYSATISGNSTGPHLHLEARDRNNQVYVDQGDVQPILGGRMTSGVQVNRTVRTNNGWQSRPHNGTDWVGPR